MGQFLFTQYSMPVLQNRLYSTRDEALRCPTADIGLIQDEQSGLVYNALFDPSLVVYDRTYNNEQAVSQRFQRHLAEVKEIIRGALGDRELVEIGCGKGTFLELLLSDGFDISGCDPAYEGSNPRVVRQAFSGQVISPAKGLVLRHVLEHIPQPFEFLDQISAANGRKGLIYIEVPCLDWILTRHAYWDVFYEHVNYFRLADLYAMFGRVVRSGRLFEGQYLYVVGDLATLRRQHSSLPPPRFDGAFAASRYGFMSPNPLAIWGCGSKGVIFSLLNQRTGRDIAIGIDINTAKQGLYMPVTGLPVCSPSKGLPMLGNDCVVCVMNGIYFDEVKAILAKYAKHTVVAIDNVP